MYIVRRIVHWWWHRQKKHTLTPSLWLLSVRINICVHFFWCLCHCSTIKSDKKRTHQLSLKKAVACMHDEHGLLNKYIVFQIKCVDIMLRYYRNCLPCVYSFIWINFILIWFLIELFGGLFTAKFAQINKIEQSLVCHTGNRFYIKPFQKFKIECERRKKWARERVKTR